MVLTQWETLCGLFFAFFEKIVVPILTSGGPASFIMPLQIGKTPIVVPRQHQFNEHVNDHQVEFARNVAKRMGTIIPVEDINTLGDIITNYDQIVASMGHGMSSNNAKFNEELEKLVNELY
jgi:UDP-N-acetylglucosamine transferase subunit ALG13